MIEKIKNEISESIDVKKSILNNHDIISNIENLSIEVLNSLKKGGKIIFCGNGGSFADSQHLAAEFISRLRFDRPSLSSIALGTNNSSLTAVGNDYGFDDIFSREINALGNKMDVFIPISTSGNSPNIINAIKSAKDKSIKVIGLSGKDGGKMKEICDLIIVPSLSTEKIQEAHIMIGHIVCSIVEQQIFKN